MSTWSSACTAHDTLIGTEGELVSVRISVEPRLLEDLLETLADVGFPINPQIYHHDTHCGSRSRTVVEFPAYTGRLRDLEGALCVGGFDPAQLAVVPMLEDLRRH